MISIAPELTAAGRSLLIRSVGGEQITFTRFKIGNGELNGVNPDDLLDILNPVVEFPITGSDTSSEGYVELTGGFDSEAITSDFRWRELGVFAQGADGVEQLYAYTNDSEHAALLKAASGSVVVEQSVSVIIAIGEAENIAVRISPSTLYPSKAEFEAHVTAENPHKMTKQKLGLDKVENVSVNDQKPTYTTPTGVTQQLTSGEILSTAMGKISRAILNFIAHLADTMNPHKVTCDQVGAAKKEHNHSASDINSGVLNPERGGTGVTSLEELKTKLALPISSFTCGTYVGDGAEDQVINIGFAPKFLFVISERMKMHEDGIWYSGLTTIDTVGNGYITPHDACMPWPNGFVVIQSDAYCVHLNNADEKYIYIAIA